MLELDDVIDEDDLVHKLRRLPITATQRSRWTGGASANGLVINCLSNNGYPEFTERASIFADPDADHNQTINVAYLDRDTYKPRVAFEVCGGVAARSVEKLNMLPESVIKVVVSKGQNQTYIERQVDRRLPDDFEHIDCQAWKG